MYKHLTSKKKRGGKETEPFRFQDVLSNSLYCFPYNSTNFSLQSLVLDQLTLPYLIFFLIFITCLLDIVLIKSEVTHGSERIDPGCFTLPQKAGFIIHYSSKSQHSSSSLMHTSRLGLTDHIAAFNILVVHTEVVDGCN